jgi:hypothetical protein
VFQGFFLHSNQAAVFVCSIDVIHFIDSWIKSIKFFVSYEIRGDDSTARMTLNAGEVDIDANTIYGAESEVNGKNGETYRDLLAVTVTSDMVEVTVKFEKPPKVEFQEFLKTNLRFTQLTSDEDETVVDVSWRILSL